MSEMSQDGRDIREGTYFNELEWTAFKACCDEAGLQRSVVLRALALKWVKQQHQEARMREAGIQDQRAKKPL